MTRPRSRPSYYPLTNRNRNSDAHLMAAQRYRLRRTADVCHERVEPVLRPMTRCWSLWSRVITTVPSFLIRRVRGRVRLPTRTCSGAGHGYLSPSKARPLRLGRRSPRLPQSMNAFPHQQRADGGLRPGARTLRGRYSVLVQVAGNGVRRLALRALPHNAGHHIVWRRPRSPKDDTVVPCTARASRVRLRMKSRSSSANTTAMCAIALPIGVRVSIPISVTINRQCCSSAKRISRAKSSVQRLARSTFVKISASDSPASSSASAALNRLRDSGGTAPDTPSSASHVISQPLVSATRSTARRWDTPAVGPGSRLILAGRRCRSASAFSSRTS
jgi:hypothetical protein